MNAPALHPLNAPGVPALNDSDGESVTKVLNVGFDTRAAVDVADATDAIEDEALEALSAAFAATAADHDRDGSLPHANFAALQRHRLIGAVAARRFGGGAATLTQARRIVRAVARGESATALVLVMTYLQHQGIGRAGSRWPEALRDEVLRSGAQQGALINALRVEPELGSPARGGLPATTARRVSEGWRLSGHKTYATGVNALSWLAVWARTDETPPRVGVFLVPRAAPGIRVIETWDHLGLRASGSHDVVLEDVSLPLSHGVDLRLPGDWIPDRSSTDLAEQNAWMVVLLGSLYDAIAISASRWLRDFLNSRVPASLGQPLSTLPRVQENVGEIEALLLNNRRLLDQAASAVDAGQLPSVTDSGLLKYLVTGNAIRVVELALQLTGNHGLSRNNPLERYHRDVLCSRIHTPQNDSILVGAGKLALARG